MAIPHPEQLLGPYLTPQQVILLRHGRLPTDHMARLCKLLRVELAALSTLVAPPIAAGDTTLESGAYWKGTILCADMSGFTALAEALAEQGRQGVEEISGLINQVFGSLLKELDVAGGVTLKFGGDALTAFFSETALGVGHAQFGCHAALAMQRRMEQFAHFETSSGSRSIQLRVGLHSGEIFVATLGDTTRRELLVSGRAVNRVALAQERADPGEVVVTSETLAALTGAVSTPRSGGLSLLQTLTPVRLPGSRLRPAPTQANTLDGALALAEQIAALRPFTPTGLPQRVLYGNRGEFRQVSMLFVNFFSFSGLLALLDDREDLALAVLNSYYRRIQEVIHRYGGSINKIDIAGHGDKLLALFGAPIAQEDDPLRATQAALSLHEALDQANAEARALLAAVGQGALQTVDPSLKQRIGVATGVVFAGSIGAHDRREYTVIGPAANLAARLMGAAKAGEVLLGIGTALSVVAQIHLRHIAPLTLKGFAEPVQAALALAPTKDDAASTLGPLVGRANEMARLRALAQQALNGAGQVLALSGEAGIGKSRLANDLMAELRRVGVRCAAASCRAYAQDAPYSVIRDFVLQLIQPTGPPSEAHIGDLRTTLATLIASQDPHLSDHLPLLYDMLSLGRHDSPAPVLFTTERRQLYSTHLPPAERRERLHQLLAVLIQALAQQPLVLMIDSIHLADASSLDAISLLASQAHKHPLLVLLLYRPEAAFAEPWLSLPHATAMVLPNLDEAASSALLSTLLGGPVPPELHPLLHRAGGSPFFLEALVQHLIDTGALVNNPGGTWKLTKTLEATSIPATIERTLVALLDRIDEPTRELIHVAAVIGTRVPYPVLSGVYSQARQLARRLTDLVAGGLFIIDEQDPEQPFLFRQSLLQEVAYNAILYGERRELHKRVATRIGQLYGDQGEAHMAELARHLLLAEDWEGAYRASLRAAHYARIRYALLEVLASLRQAYVLANEHPHMVSAAEHMGILEELADNEALAGQFDAAHQHYQLLLNLFTNTSDLTASIQRKVGSLYEQQGQFDLALIWLRRAYALIGASKPLEQVRVSSSIGWVHFRRGDLAQAQIWLERAETLLTTNGGDQVSYEIERAAVQNRLGGVAWMRGDLAAAQVAVERSLAACIALGDMLGEANARNNLGILAEQQGDWERAIESYEGALAVNNQIGRRREAALSLLNLGTARLHRGDIAAALLTLELAATEIAAVDDTLHEVMALRWLGRARTRASHWDAAAETLGRADILARRHGLLLDRLDVATARGELAIARGELAAARSARSEGTLLIAEVDRRSLEAALFLRLNAFLARTDGDALLAAGLLAESDDILQELGMANMFSL